ncbi:MAG: DNA-3-methyladenine glycosylase [Spirochaetaceae bacterium]|jgi:DNA-3-methyladenine glycosylase|nr:DNA-3-methyladenine glycosylase [Spirochaetaceae bacterium]
MPDKKKLTEPRRLSWEDYSAPSTTLAPRLIGKIICRQKEGAAAVRSRITETEAYYGEQDSACHASKGRTERTKVMYNPGGCAYIYLCYGVHWMFNVVSGPKDFPQAVLIRGVEGYDGPGKLTRALAIDKSLNCEDLTSSKRLWIEDDGANPEYEELERVGVDYAREEDRKRLWRFRLLSPSKQYRAQGAKIAL